MIKKIIAFCILICMFTTTAFAQELTVTGSYANCRRYATQNSEYMGRVYKGETYQILGSDLAPNGIRWYRIQQKSGKGGYVCSSFVRVNDSSNISSSKTNNITGQLKIKQSCNVRSAAGQNNTYLGRANYGKAYGVLGSGKAPNGKLWYKIQYGSKTGWVCSSFVTYSSKSTTVSPAPASSGDRVYIGEFYITGYCPTCNSPKGHVTGSGKYATAGRTCAMNLGLIKSKYPYGTRIYIEGIGERVVEDNGCAKNVIDVFCDRHGEEGAITGYRDVWLIK